MTKPNVVDITMPLTVRPKRPVTRPKCTWIYVPCLDQFGPMKAFANSLRSRASQLGMSNAEVARRLGISERRYAHYVTGDREPDLRTFVRIAQILLTSPNQLLEFGDDSANGGERRIKLMDKITTAAKEISTDHLEFFAIQIDAISIHLGSRDERPMPLRRDISDA